MKPVFQRFLPFSVLILVSVAVGTAFLWVVSMRSAGLREGEVCERNYQGTVKGTFFSRGEWHHYVDVGVDVRYPENYQWRVLRSPMPSSIWHRYFSQYKVRIAYRWPSNWWDPFTVNQWEICRLER
ncbi:MAG: hypothetical protein DPW18_15350 [Chloroflexi bacterium]|nr:hypothetical protein [Chloroflexota bacterium]MDL1911386.1 hypothetical protein [Chloroflexi bacterium CFX6]